MIAPLGRGTHAAALGALAMALGAATLPAQGWREVEITRHVRDSSALNVRVPYFGGRLGVRPTGGAVLFRSQLRYDPRTGDAVYAFDSSTRSLQVGTRGVRLRGGDSRGRGGSLRLDLSRGVPLDLGFDLTGVEGDIDLSGLRLSRLRLESAASDVRVRFDTLNAVRLASLELNANAAGIRAEQLANANARDVRVHARLGGADLDFGGVWTSDIELRVDVLLGDVTIRVPGDVGLRIEVDKVLASFQHDGLVQRGGAYVSENWDDARFKLHVRAETTLGKLEVDRRGR